MAFDVSILAKDLPAAKRRLRPRLGRDGARRFAEYCLRRVLRAVSTWRGQGCIRVVTNGPETAAVASACGAAVWYQQQPGLAEAAREALILRPALPRVVLMADLPLLAASDLEALECVATDHALTLIPDRHEHGINGFVFPPGCDLVPELGYGDGFLRNRRLAEQQGLPWRAWSTPALALDCDSERDYEAFLAACRT